MWIWEHDNRTDDYKIILNCVLKLVKNKLEKMAGKGSNVTNKESFVTMNQGSHIDQTFLTQNFVICFN